MISDTARFIYDFMIDVELTTIVGRLGRYCEIWGNEEKLRRLIL